MKNYKTYLMAAIVGSLLAMCVKAWSFDISKNPDRYASVGLDVSSGHLAGINTTTVGDEPHTDGGYVKGLLDLRVPISNAVTVHAFGSSTSINNNRQFSDGNEFGMGLRVYLQ